jgi:hypothetical protein
VRAAPKALVRDNARSVRCGKLAPGTADGGTDLLAGRLRVRAPTAAKTPPPAADAPPLEEESRIVVESQAEKERTKLALAIVARETSSSIPISTTSRATFRRSRPRSTSRLRSS